MYIAATLLKSQYIYHVNLYGAIIVHSSYQKITQSKKKCENEEIVCFVAVVASLFFFNFFLVTKCTHAPILTHQNTSSLRCLFLFINFCVKFLYARTQRKKTKKKIYRLSVRCSRECFVHVKSKRLGNAFIDDNDSDDD